MNEDAVALVRRSTSAQGLAEQITDQRAIDRIRNIVSAVPTTTMEDATHQHRKAAA